MMQGTGHKVVELLETAPCLFQLQFGPFLSNLPTRIISNKAASVTKAAVGIVANVGVDKEMDDFAILGPESNRDIPNGVATAQLLENLQNEFFFVGTEFHNGLTNVFLCRISEHIELSLVGP